MSIQENVAAFKRHLAQERRDRVDEMLKRHGYQPGTPLHDLKDNVQPAHKSALQATLNTPNWMEGDVSLSAMEEAKRTLLTANIYLNSQTGTGHTVFQFKPDISFKEVFLALTQIVNSELLAQRLRTKFLDGVGTPPPEMSGAGGYGSNGELWFNSLAMKTIAGLRSELRGKPKQD